MKWLKEEGIVEELQSKALVVDTEALRQVDVAGGFSRRNLFGKNFSKINLVYYAFKDRTGVSREDYEHREFTPKLILYLPEDEKSV